MRDVLLQTFIEFMQVHVAMDDQLLLGCSGGVDSSALLELFGLAKRFLSPFSLLVVHFDHGWRQESAKEAVLVQENALKLGFSFRGGRSEKGRSYHNAEEVARKERLAFFQEVYQTTHAKALFLAHQRDDQVETFLKRMCEGARLVSLSGMAIETKHSNMRILRPLLHTARQDIMTWNMQHNVSFVVDATNSDPAFLRSRMRHVMIPQLEEAFGKGISRNLSRLSEELRELKEALQQHHEELYVLRAYQGTLGIRFCLKGLTSMFWKRQFLSFCLHKHLGREFSSHLVELCLGKECMYPLLHTILFVQKEEVGLLSLKNIEWHISFESDVMILPLLDALWDGTLVYPLSKEMPWEFVTAKSLESRERKRLASFFAHNRIPALLRKLIPVIVSCGTVVFPATSNSIKTTPGYNFLVIKLKNTAN